MKYNEGMFLKWLIATLTIGIAVGVLQDKYSIFTEVAANDYSYMVWSVYAVFVFGVFLCLKRCWSQDNCFGRVDYLIDLMPKLGILGTAIGMIGTLWLGFKSGIRLGDEASLEAFWNILFEGGATSLLTTAVGLIGSIVLSFYVFILKDYSNETTNIAD